MKRPRKESPVTCVLCQKLFKSSAAIRMHLWRVHSPNLRRVHSPNARQAYEGGRTQVTPREWDAAVDSVGRSEQSTDLNDSIKNSAVGIARECILSARRMVKQGREEMTIGFLNLALIALGVSPAEAAKEE